MSPFWILLSEQKLPAMVMPLQSAADKTAKQPSTIAIIFIYNNQPPPQLIIKTNFSVGRGHLSIIVYLVRYILSALLIHLILVDPSNTLPIFPDTDLDCVIRQNVLALTMLLSILPQPLIPSSVSPDINTIPMLLVHMVLAQHQSFHSPSQRLPSRHVQIPFPCMLLSFQVPSYFRPSSQVYTPDPFILFQCQSPTQRDPSFHVQVPFPCFLPSWQYPSYLDPSAQVSTPHPSCKSSFQYPSYLAPF